jgi:hypothetical protein
MRVDDLAGNVIPIPRVGCVLRAPLRVVTAALTAQWPGWGAGKCKHEADVDVSPPAWLGGD